MAPSEKWVATSLQLHSKAVHKDNGERKHPKCVGLGVTHLHTDRWTKGWVDTNSEAVANRLARHSKTGIEQNCTKKENLKAWRRRSWNENRN